MSINKTWRTPLTLLIAAIVPLFVVAAGVYLIVTNNMSEMAIRQTAEFKPIVMDAHKEELRNAVKVAQKVIKHVRNTRGDSAAAKREALDLLRTMDAGDDFYIFVYDMNGINLMHPRMTSWEGTSKWDLRDKNGKLIIQELIEAAKRGGDYVEYLFRRPETKNLEPKLGYAEMAPDWGWMIGTGLYLDQLQKTNALIKSTTDNVVTGMADRILLIALLSVCVVSATGLGFNYFEQRRANSKLRDMAHKVVDAQEMERKRVSRELHDGVSNPLFSVKCDFAVALVHAERNSPDASTQLRKSLLQMSVVMGEVRRISHDLRSTLLEDLPLSNVLEQTVREFGEHSGIAVETLIVAPPLRVPDTVATAVFRLTQEALGNIARHSEANQVHVNMTFNGHPAGLRLEIRDNGKGFDVDALMRTPREGLGLTNMRFRIEMLEGEFSVVSGPSGTTISVFIPAAVLKGA